MIDFEFLEKGVFALARAHRVNAMAGHLGATVAAGYFIGELNPELDNRVYAGIEGELVRILRGESGFSPGEGAAVTVRGMFDPFPGEPGRLLHIEGIAEALSENIDQTRQSGHNVIFAAIAIRALTDHPEFATPAITDGIRRLIAGFNNATPGSGNYGKGRGRIDGRRVVLTEEAATPPYADLSGMAAAVIEELIRHASERREGYGGMWHVINHAAALAELSRYGYPELAARGLAAHHQHLQLWKSLPDLSAELGAETAAPHDPRTAAFWQTDDLRRDRALLDHRIKTLYGFDALIDLIEDPVRRQRANEKLRYLM